MTKNELRTVMMPFFLVLTPFGLAVIMTQLMLISSNPLLAIATTLLNGYTLYRLVKLVVKQMTGEDDNA